MVYFILDTSTDLLIMGLSTSQGLIAQRTIPHENGLSRLLLPSIENFLQEQQVDKKALSCICPGIGPGSYTGTRSGVIVAQTLGYALDIPQLPFCSLLISLPPIQGTFSYLHSMSHKDRHYLLRGTIQENHLVNLDLQPISCLSTKLSILEETDHLIIDPASPWSKDCLHRSVHAPSIDLSLLCSYLHEKTQSGDPISSHLPLSLIYSAQPGDKS